MQKKLKCSFSMLFISLFGMISFFYLPGNCQTSKPPGISTDNNYTTETLVRDIFVKGSCDNVSNITKIGNKEGIGYFENGMDVIGLDKGIILATGNIKGAEGPNNATRKSGDFKDNSGDQDLKLLVTNRVYDAVGIEFDFIPLDSFVAFRYVFASEEYCEFVGREFNDVFGFFVSGPGIDGEFSNQSKNVALVPGTKDFVAINSVNHKINKDYYISNVTNDDATNCGIPFLQNPRLQLIEYDGFTTVLNASLKLFPCQTYHIRFVVADVGDNFYDSAVFLEAGSFNLGGEVVLRTEMEESSAPDIVEEGCDAGYFVFERSDISTLDFPLTVQFKASNRSTAVEGVDFSELPKSITIPKGETMVRLPVNIYNDYLAESQESVILELDIPCACYTGFAEMIIQDAPPMRVTVNDMVVCTGDDATLIPEINGGTAPFSYLWEDGSGASERVVSPVSDSTFRVTITDACQNFVEKEIEITLRSIPSASLSGELEICEGDTALLLINFTGNPPFSFSYSRNNVIERKISGVRSNPYLLPVSLEGVYHITQFSDSLCGGVSAGSGKIVVKRFETTWEVVDASCIDSNDGSIQVNISGGKVPYIYGWQNNLSTNAQVSGLGVGDYGLTVTDNDGCRKSYIIPVESPPAINPVTFRCEDISRGVIQIEASGGVGPYSYSINGRDFYNGDLFKSLTPGQRYDLTIKDKNQCLLEQEFVMPAPFDKIVTIPSEIKLDLGKRFIIEPELQIPENLVEKVSWFPFEHLSCQDCLNPEIIPLENTFYTLKVTDIFGCGGSATTTIKVVKNVSLFIPSAFSPNGDAENEWLTIFANDWQVKKIDFFKIFDRWGNLVFENADFLPNDPNSGWNGTLNGKLLPVGIYVFFAQATLIDGSSEFVQGQVMLMN